MARAAEVIRFTGIPSVIAEKRVQHGICSACLKPHRIEPSRSIALTRKGSWAAAWLALSSAALKRSEQE